MTDPTADLVIRPEAWPEAPELTAMLKSNLEAMVAGLRAERGEVVAPEDTYSVLRPLAGVADGLRTYAAAFREVAKTADQMAEEELIDAVHEQDGVPLAGMSVPDVDGTVIKVNRLLSNTHTYDDHTLAAAVAHYVMWGWSVEVDRLCGRSTSTPGGSAEVSIASMIIEACTIITQLGVFDPQVTKVKAFLSNLSTTPGGARAAAAVSSTYRKTTEYKGVQLKREQGR